MKTKSHRPFGIAGSFLPVLAPVLLILFALSTEAEVTRIVITSREVVAGGMSFGSLGPYEKIRGTVFFEVSPTDFRNAAVFDIEKAPRNSRGLVEFSADFFILKPVELEQGNGLLLFEVNNRGNKAALLRLNDILPSVPVASINNPTTADHLGNGFLMQEGYTLAWVGWQADLTPGASRLTVQFPIAGDNGNPITELTITEFSDRNFAGTPFTLPLSGSSDLKSYESVSTDQMVAQAELRMRPSDSPRPSAPDIPAGDIVAWNRWSFANCPNGPPGTPSKVHICFADRFQTNMVYQLIYRASGTSVNGLGYLTTRDFVSFLRNALSDSFGTPNPIAGLNTVLCYGFSQSGFYLRDFIYEGFNEDELGRRVCDGAFIHAAGARKLPLNYRFAKPDVTSVQHVGRYVPDSNFPVTYPVRQDPVSGQVDGILKRPATDPKIIHADSSTEYWQSRSSLVDTKEDGSEDLPPNKNVRRYLLSSTQHVTRKELAPTLGKCQQLSNSTHQGPFIRALLVVLAQWVRDGVKPPNSRIPRLDEGTLVPSDQASTLFPTIPGVNYNGLFNASGERDFGLRVSGNSGVVDNLVPTVLSVHSVLVPKVDPIGNEIAGIRHPLVEAPVATLTGWNLSRAEFTDGDLCDRTGMTVPLPRTKAEREASGDPRPSLEELYGDHKRYVKQITAAALRLMRHRFLLFDDVIEIVKKAETSDVLR